MERSTRARDPHSLIQQLAGICWGIATYQAIRTSWRTELAEDGDTFNITPLLFHFITDNFTKGLCLNLRRLTENGKLIEPSPKGDDKSVYSLASVLADIKMHREEYTRRRLFLACKVEYDTELIRRRNWEYLLQFPSGQAVGVPRDLNPRNQQGDA